MTSEKEFFIHLLGCFLNGEEPRACEVDWQAVYELASKHDVLAIIAQEARALPPEAQPSEEIMSCLRQSIGHTIIDSEQKDNALAEADRLLGEWGIDHIFVKGAVIKPLYPVSEFRTSGDIDAIVRAQDADRLSALLDEAGVKYSKNADGIMLYVSDVMLELHFGSNVESAYFDNAFDLCTRAQGCRYEMDEYSHLLYVICHICHHLRYMGAGIRMLMDVDVCIRGISDFDEKRFFALCRAAGVEKSARAIISLAALWFSTPVEAEDKIVQDESLLAALESVMLDGGTFGYSASNLGDYYISKGYSAESGSVSALRLRAVWRLLFPETAQMKHYYPYAERCPLLLPIAYLSRLFGAIFRRGRHSRDTLREIIKNDTGASLTRLELLSELGIITGD